MKAVFLKELEDTLKKVEELRTNESFVFNIIADSHCHPNNPQWWERYENTLENIAEFNRQCKTDAIFHLGDVVWVGPKEYGATDWCEDNIKAQLRFIKSHLIDCNKNSFFIAGNHDGIDGAEPQKEMWADVMLPRNNPNVQAQAPYYFVDFPDKKVRAIAIFSCYRDPSGVYYGFYGEQLKFLKKALNTAPDGYKILMFSHVAPVVVDERRLDNCEEFKQFITAYNNREKVGNSQITADFTNAKATVKACFIGHGHVDWVSDKQDFPCRIIETATNHVHTPRPEEWAMPKTAFVPARAYGTVTEDLWDTVVYNPKTDTLNIVRFGAGNDRIVKL